MLLFTINLFLYASLVQMYGFFSWMSLKDQIKIMIYRGYVKIAYLIQHTCRHVTNLANYFHLILYEVTCFGILHSLILSKYHFMQLSLIITFLWPWRLNLRHHPCCLTRNNRNYADVNGHRYPKDFRAPWPIFFKLFITHLST